MWIITGHTLYRHLYVPDMKKEINVKILLSMMEKLYL